MAGKIRGITIELSADASGVLDSLKKINSEISSTGKQLKDVDRLLKLDPTNTTLLTQKTQLLQEQIQNTKDKLDALKQAQADMDANGVDKNSEQYQALQREIIATEQELDKLKNTAGSGSAALAKVSAVTGQIGDKMESVGKKMSVVSAAITAIGTAAVAAFNEVDSGADIVIKKTGATGEAAEELEQSYKNVAKNIVADFDDIGSAVGEVNTRFKLTGDDLEDLSEEFLKFADINEMDVTQAVSGVDMAMKTFNVDQSEAQNVMGLLSKTSQDTGISMDTLLGLLQSSGATLKEMGLDLGSSVTLMGQFEAAGIDSNEMLGKMSKAAVYFNKNGMDMNTGLSDLITRLQDSSTEADATAEVYEIFGTKAGLAFITAAKEGKLGLGDLSTALSDYGTVVDDTYQQTLDGTDSMKLAWQNMQLAMSELGEVIGNTLAPVMEKITEVIQSVTEWFSNLDEGTKETIVTIAGLVAAIGPLLVIGGKVMSGISSITGALSKLGSSSFGPIGLVIAGVAALVAGVTALATGLNEAYKEASPFTDAINDLQGRNADLAASIEATRSAYETSTAASEAAATSAQGLYQHLQDLIAGYDGSAAKQAEIEATVRALNETVPGLGLSWDNVTNSLNKNSQEIYANIEAMRAQAQVAALQDMYTESLKQQYQAQKDLTDASRTASEVLQAYGLTFQDVADYAKGGVLAEAEWSAKLMESGVALWNVNDATEEIMMAMDGYLDASKNSKQATEDVTFAETELANAMAAAAEATTASMSDIERACSDAFGSIPPELQIAIDAAEDAGVDIPQSLIDGIKNGTVSVEDACKQLAEATNKSEEAKVSASDMAESYTDTMASEISAAAGEVEQAAQAVVDELDQSDDAYDYGKDTGSSFDEGLDSQTGNIQDTAENIADTVTTAMEPLPGDMGEAGDSAGGNLEGGFGDWKGTIEGTAEETYNYFLHFFSEILPPMMKTWGSGAGMNLNQGLQNYVPDIQNTINSIVNDIDSLLSVLPGWMEAAGYNAGAGLYNGLAAWEGALSSLAWSIANSINAAARQALQINSPSKVMEETGEYTGEGLEGGLENSKKGILKTMSNIANSIVESFSGLDITSGLNAINSTRNISMLSSNSRSNNSTTAMSQVVGILMQYLPYLAADKDIHFDDGQWAGKLAPAMNEALAGIQIRSARG